MNYIHTIEGLEYNYKYQKVEIFGEVEISIGDDGGITKTVIQGKDLDFIGNLRFYKGEDETMFLYNPSLLQAFILDRFNSDLIADVELYDILYKRYKEEGETDIAESKIYK